MNHIAIASSLRKARDVEPIDQYPIYELGAALSLLKESARASEHSSAQTADQIYAVWTAQNQLRRLLSGNPFQIVFSNDAAENLLGSVTRMTVLLDGQSTSSPPGPAPEPWQWFQVRSNIDVFEHQFSAELKKMAAYAVPERGIYKIDGLVDNADKHIHHTVIDIVDDFARAELKAAGRCLAFGLCAASGFHSARAVECVLKQFCALYLPNLAIGDLTMGQMVSALGDMHTAKEKKDLLPSANTLRHLKDFTEFDRNPVIHKMVVVEEIDAHTLFNSAAAVIVEMAKAIKTGGRSDRTISATVNYLGAPFEKIDVEEQPS
ncbi:MAG: hypothetical protein ABI885_18060 [Gammaproteobacteria bacterium]